LRRARHLAGIIFNLFFKFYYFAFWPKLQHNKNDQNTTVTAVSSSNFNSINEQIPNSQLFCTFEFEIGIVLQ